MTAEEYARRLARMIQCKTVSVKGAYDDAEFAKLRRVVEAKRIVTGYRTQSNG